MLDSQIKTSEQVSVIIIAESKWLMSMIGLNTAGKIMSITTNVS